MSRLREMLMDGEVEVYWAGVGAVAMSPTGESLRREGWTELGRHPLYPRSVLMARQVDGRTHMARRAVSRTQGSRS